MVRFFHVSRHDWIIIFDFEGSFKTVRRDMLVVKMIWFLLSEITLTLIVLRMCNQHQQRHKVAEWRSWRSSDSLCL